MMANMQLPQLEAFAETARLGNVSRAAEMLNLTQPALTARLQGLEGDLGVDLCVRGARGMTLTDAGRALLPYAQRVLAQVIEGRKAVQDLRGGKVGELLIGAAPAVSTYFLPGVLKTYQATHRDVRLGVRTGHTEEVLEMVLRRGPADGSGGGLPCDARHARVANGVWAARRSFQPSAASARTACTPSVSLAICVIRRSTTTEPSASASLRLKPCSRCIKSSIPSIAIRAASRRSSWNPNVIQLAAVRATGHWTGKSARTSRVTCASTGHSIAVPEISPSPCAA